MRAESARAGIRWGVAGVMMGMVLLTASCSRAEEPSEGSEAMKIAQSAKKPLVAQLAGAWYTANRADLLKELRGYIEAAETPPLDNVHALIQPHAGYRFSGPTAAYGARQVQGRTFRRVVVMGPSHRVAMPNTVSVPDATSYTTPLGELPLDTDFIRRCQESANFRVVPRAQEGENSVEMQIPMLQAALGEFKLVPLVVGQLDEEAVQAIAAKLLSLVDQDTLVVASSDFTHYGPNYGYVPFSKDIPANLEKLDLGAVDLIRRRDLAGFRDYCRRTGATICGHEPIVLLLAMLLGDWEAHLLHYDTSGRMLDDYDNSVSYVSLAFTGRWPEQAPSRGSDVFPMEEDEKKSLLKLARGTINYYMEHGKMPQPEDVGVTITPNMQQVAGAFVTLQQKGQLRGCIGEIFPRRPVFEAVIEQAVNAAVNDPRFKPVSPREVPGLHIEISVLTPPRPVDSWKDIEIGRHGMILNKRGRQALFLPQVAPEQGWGIEETLTHLAMKAGLPPDAWREGAQYSVFEALVFGEE